MLENILIKNNRIHKDLLLTGEGLKLTQTRNMFTITFLNGVCLNMAAQRERPVITIETVNRSSIIIFFPIMLCSMRGWIYT